MSQTISVPLDEARCKLVDNLLSKINWKISNARENALPLRTSLAFQVFRY
jgi:hypothetical protein